MRTETANYTSMAPLGLAIAGSLADVIGVRVWFVMGGTLIIIMGIAGFFVPSVVHIEEHTFS